MSIVCDLGRIIKLNSAAYLNSIRLTPTCAVCWLWLEVKSVIPKYIDIDSRKISNVV